MITRSFGNMPSLHTQKSIAQDNRRQWERACADAKAIKKRNGRFAVAFATFFAVLAAAITLVALSGCSSPDPAVQLSVDRLSHDLPVLQKDSKPRNPANQVAYDKAWASVLGNVAALSSVVK